MTERTDFGVLYGQKTTEDALLIYSSYEDAKASPKKGDFIILTPKNESGQKFLTRVEAEIYDEDPIFRSQDKTLVAVHYARIAERELSERDKQKMFSYTYKVQMLGTFTDSGQKIEFTTAVRKLPVVSYHARHLSKREVDAIINKPDSSGVSIGELCIGEDVHKDKGDMLFDVQRLREKRTMVFAQSGFGKTNLVKGDPVSTQLCTVKEALKLGASAVGYTIYLGSVHESKMLKDFERPYKKLARFTEISNSLILNKPKILYWDLSEILKFWGTASEFLHFLGTHNRTYDSEGWIVSSIARIEAIIDNIWSRVTGTEGVGLLNPDTMKLVGTTIEEQTKRVLDNLSIVLAGVGLTLKNIVKTTVYLKDMNDFKGMNKVYGEMFQEHKPSRTTISVKQNPLDALVEIECIAELQL